MACYHSKTGAVELLLNHLFDEAGEYVVVEMTTGADSFASGLFTRFDLTVLVAEPTLRAVSVHRQYRAYAAGFDVPIVVVGNKVEDAADEAFLREAVGDDLIEHGCVRFQLSERPPGAASSRGCCDQRARSSTSRVRSGDIRWLAMSSGQVATSASAQSAHEATRA
jgi:hypothetical protein